LFFFVDDRACESIYIFDTDVEAKVPNYYIDLVNDLNDVYGLGKSFKNYTSPYQEGDGNELLGLSAGKIDYHTLWMDDKKNTITAEIIKKMEVELTYQDDILFDKYLSQQKAKEKSDY